MKRRFFTFRLAAVPALPLAAATVPQAKSAQLATAKMLARAHNRCSPAMLARLMRINGGLAAELNAAVFRKSLITAAGADGASMAVSPINTNCIPKQAFKPINLIQKARDLNAKLDAVLKDAGPDDLAPAKED